MERAWPFAYGYGRALVGASLDVSTLDQNFLYACPDNEEQHNERVTGCDRNNYDITRVILKHESAMSTSQPRVPAWKRLGLRLKYAKETADDPTMGNEHHDAAAEPSEKPARESELTDSTRPAKKRRISPPQIRHTGQNGPSDGVFDSITSSQDSPPNAIVHNKTVLSSTETGEPADHEEVHHNAE